VAFSNAGMTRKYSVGTYKKERVKGLILNI